MARLPTMAAATGCERSTMPCLMAVTCTLSTTITVSTAVGSASPAFANSPVAVPPSVSVCPPFPSSLAAAVISPVCIRSPAAACPAAVPAAGSGADECLPAAADRSGSSRSAMNSCLQCTIRRLIQLQSNGIISEAAILICEEAFRARRPRHIRPSWRRSPARPPSECPAFP